MRLSAGDSSLALGPSVLPGTMCTWSIDLGRNSSDVKEWSFQVSLDSFSVGQLVLLPYLSGKTQTAPDKKYVFGAPEKEIKIKTNYLEVRFSTGTSQTSYTGFLLTWRSSSDSDSNDFLAKIISIIAVTLLVVICCGCCGICFYKLLHNLRSSGRYVLASRVAPTQRYDEIQRNHSVIILSEENLHTLLPKDKYRKELLEVGEAVCTVCLDEFTSNSEVRKLPCKHLFHARCIEDWLAAQGGLPNCPMCKRNPFQTIMHSRSNSQLLRSEVDLA